jgi:hypothetical protein
MLAGEDDAGGNFERFSYLEKADIGAALEGAARHVTHREITLSK